MLLVCGCTPTEDTAPDASPPAELGSVEETGGTDTTGTHANPGGAKDQGRAGVDTAGDGGADSDEEGSDSTTDDGMDGKTAYDKKSDTTFVEHKQEAPNEIFAVSFDSAMEKLQEELDRPQEIGSLRVLTNVSAPVSSLAMLGSLLPLRFNGAPDEQVPQSSLWYSSVLKSFAIGETCSIDVVAHSVEIHSYNRLDQETYLLRNTISDRYDVPSGEDYLYLSGSIRPKLVANDIDACKEEAGDALVTLGGINISGMYAMRATETSPFSVAQTRSSVITLAADFRDGSVLAEIVDETGLPLRLETSVYAVEASKVNGRYLVLERVADE